MKNKKSKKANLEKSKTLFLLVGFIMAVAFVITAFQWQSEKVLFEVKSEIIEPPIEIYPIVTTNDIIEQPKQKDEIVQEKKEIIDKILITESVKEVQTKIIKNPDIPINKNIIIIPEPKEDDEDKIWITTGTPAKFNGGILALRRWIDKNINYPALAKETGIQGTVYLRFEVKKDGTIGKIELQKGVDTLLDDEAIRVIKKLPRFKAGMQNGKKVNVWFSIPISFKLN